MTIASELTKLNTNLTNSYTAVSGKGGTLPSAQNMDNLATAISSIPSGTTPVITSLNVTPTTSAQTITAPSGTDGYSPVNVSAVTSSIDSNITAGNIKSGVSILGVTGTYSGTTPTGTLSITANGVYDVTNYASADVSVSGGGTGSAILTIESSSGGGAFSNSYILVNDDIIYYSSNEFPNRTFTVTVPKGNVTITCISYLGNYVTMTLGDGPLGTGTWDVWPDHDSPGDVAVVTKTLEITADTTLYFDTNA